MAPFELVEPRSMHEAAAALGASRESILPIAGGTAVMLMMKMGVLRPWRLVSLRSVERRCSEIAVAADGSLRIGAMATLSAMERSDVVRSHAPVITGALRTLSNVRVRNVATLGGHLAHADPHLDLPPVLIALGASVVTMTATGGRSLALEDLYTGYLETTLAPGELIAEIVVPPLRACRASYLKCTVRSADDWPALGVAAAIEADGGVVRGASLVLGAVTDRPVRLSAAESALRGGRADEAALRRAGEAAAEEIAIVADAHGSVAYKRELVRVYVARAIRAALEKR